MKCKTCSSLLIENAKFCLECGAPVPKTPDPPEPVESTQFPPMLTVELLARFLFISKTSVYELINKEGLPWVPILKQKRFVTSEVLEWAKRKQANGGVPA